MPKDWSCWGGNYALANEGNVVGDIASDAGKVRFVNDGDLKFGSLTATYADGSKEIVTGITNTGDVSLATDGNLAITKVADVGAHNLFLTIGEEKQATQDEDGAIKAGGLALNGGDFELRIEGNVVGDIASAAGTVAFVGTGDLTVGTLTETDGNGDLVKTTTGITNTGDVSLATDGDLTISEELTTTGNVALAVSGKTTQDAAQRDITAQGLALSGGDYALTNVGNTVGDIASNAGTVDFTNSGDLRVGELTITHADGSTDTLTGVNNTAISPAGRRTFATSITAT